MHIHEIKNKKRNTMQCLLALMLSSATAVSFADVSINITGTITPGFCTPTIENGGAIDLGSISASTIPDNYNALPPVKLNLTIDCGNTPIKVGLKTSDNKPAGIIPGAGSVMWGQTDAQVYSLGKASNGKVTGIYFIAILQDQFTGDGATAKAITSTDNGASWENIASSGSYVYMTGNRMTSWTNQTTGIITATSFKRFDGKITIGALLNKSSELPLTNTIKLDGSATLQLVYI